MENEILIRYAFTGRARAILTENRLEKMIHTRTVNLFILVVFATVITSYSCRHQETEYNNHGRGNMVYFDRHKLRCGDMGMMWFKLYRGSRNKIRFEYQCCELPKKTGSRVFQTAFTYDGRGRLVYLDRQRVSCGGRGIISGFNLQRNRRRDHVRFNVICNDYNRLSCKPRQNTPFNDDGNGKSYYLDRHRVECSHGYFLNNFRLERDKTQRQIRMVYKCCKPS